MKKITIGKLLLTLLMIMIVVVTGTYAWFSYQSKKSALVLTIGDLNDSQVIITPYEIRDTMLPVNSYSSGVYSQITVINNNDSKMNMELYYKVNTLPQELAQNGLKYTIVQSDSKNGTYNEVLTGDFSTYSNESEIDIFNITINSNTTTYYRLYLWLDTNYGNQTILENTKLDLELNANISRSANEPILDSGMIPVTISNDGTVTTISSDDDTWYDYSNKQWANAILVTESSRSNYLNTTDIVVQESDILAYYVWIPRYKYKIWTTSTSSAGNEKEIEIIFENKNTPKSEDTTIGEYLTHPAFTFGDEELSGFWVGKFETTGTASTPTVLPNVTSLRNQNVSTQFQTSLKFAGGTLSNGNVSFEGSNTYGLTTNTDSHMMKNSEWGAVAYLSHSKYGINEELYTNNSSGYYTGRSGGNVGGSVNTLATQFSDTSDSSSNTYNNYGYYTWLGQAVNYDGTVGKITDATLGTKASTTGNITGIYDMLGGAYDRVMGVYSDSDGNPRSGYNSSNNSGFNGVIYDSGNNTSYTSGIDFPSSKYYDLYLQSQFKGDYSNNKGYCTLATCGGHALYETAGWYSDYSSFVDSSNPWFERGGNYNNGSNSGTFYSDSNYGNSYSDGSWRSVLVNTQYSTYYNINYNPNGGSFSTLYTEPGEHIYNALVNGEYNLEVWGAQGGTTTYSSTTYNGGYGGYSLGQISLSKSDVIYINVGGKGSCTTSSSTNISGGYNGGGMGNNSNVILACGGGGATHVAKSSGILSKLSSNTNSILIVAGGGSGAYYYSGYTGQTSGNSGGGYIGGYSNLQSAAGTQSSGYAFGTANISTSYSSTTNYSGGGGGYYGGIAYWGEKGAGGGSGYIGNALLTNKYMYCYNCTTSDEESTKTYTTTNVSSTPTVNYAKSGNGAARISTTSNMVEMYNSNYNNMPSASRDGYIFKGWNTAQDGSGIYVTNGSSLAFSNDHSLYAQWEALLEPTLTTSVSTLNIKMTSTGSGSFTYTYNGDGTLSCNSSNTSVATCTVNTSNNTVNITAVGVGNTSITLNSSAGATYNLTSTTVSVNVSLQTYTISYNANGGSGAPSSQTKTYGVTLTLSNVIPTRSGYIFLGWSTSSGATSATWSAGGSYTLNEGVTLYAIWKVGAVSITYNLNGGYIWENIATYTDPGEYIYTVPLTGEYKLEVWGAQGGYAYSTSYLGGYGGYSGGRIYLTESTNLYVNVGGKGADEVDSSAAHVSLGGYNGGGNGINFTSESGRYIAGGGGATHIATISGVLSTLSGNIDSILIVAGGGAGSSYFSSYYYTATAGSGGGISGTNGIGYYDGTKYTSNGGTQTTGNAFGLGGTGTQEKPGGGGGYYGGISDSFRAGGGSGYIGNSLLSNKYMYCYNCTTSDEESTKTYTTTNVSSTPTANYAKSGDGAAKITFGRTVVVKSINSNSTYGEVQNPTKDGYVFVGWNTKQDGSGIYVTSSSNLVSTENHTLYAIWMDASIPIFNYTGTYKIVDDNDNEITNPSTYAGNWKIRFLTDGTLTLIDLKATNGVDIFIVGGGGAGASGASYWRLSSPTGGGGGGGASITVTNFPIAANTSYTLDIGGSNENTVFKKGTTAYYTALAGSTPDSPSVYSGGWDRPQGTGGSGRLSGETSNYGASSVVAKAGGASGADGNYEFFGTSGKRYGAGCGGADGGGRYGSGAEYTTTCINATAGTSGTANSGSGGGGGGGTAGTGTTTWCKNASGGAGGSGIIIIRNHR